MRYEKQKFQAVVVELDGNEYYGCEFDDCTLMFRARAPFVLNGCEFGAIKWAFRDAAQLTVNAMRGLHEAGFTAAIEKTCDIICGRTREPGNPILQ